LKKSAVKQIIDNLLNYYEVLTITELADIIGVSQSTISSWVNRNSVSAIVKRCKQLKLPLEIYDVPHSTDFNLAQIEGIKNIISLSEIEKYNIESSDFDYLVNKFSDFIFMKIIFQKIEYIYQLENLPGSQLDDHTTTDADIEEGEIKYGKKSLFKYIFHSIQSADWKYFNKLENFPYIFKNNNEIDELVDLFVIDGKNYNDEHDVKPSEYQIDIYKNEILDAVKKHFVFSDLRTIQFLKEHIDVIIAKFGIWLEEQHKVNLDDLESRNFQSYLDDIYNGNVKLQPGEDLPSYVFYDDPRKKDTFYEI
jgi:transcriptional regulator with XRE-family HTH domain